VEAATLAGLDEAKLAAALRPLWENAQPLVPRLAGRPFVGWTEVIDAAEQEIAGMDAAERTQLLRAHPRIGEARYRLRDHSETSWREQGGDATVDPATGSMLNTLNERYERRFGFPFVEWVDGRPMADMVEVLARRLPRGRATELRSGCAALVAIARDRLRRIEAGEGCVNKGIGRCRDAP
jgi:2-oxo-4-hydroxy-4-carboxy--5-ureidoimidazoline (OHCU) decarboxylase